MPSEQNIMLSGRHGIGKSEMLTKFYADKGLKVIALKSIVVKGKEKYPEWSEKKPDLFEKKY